MKNSRRFGWNILLGIVLLISCDKNNDPDPLLGVSVNDLLFTSPEEGTLTFEVMSNIPWSIAVSSTNGWCSVDKLSGKDNDVVKVSVRRNTSGAARTATITVNGAEEIATITVSQPFLKLSLVDIPAGTFTMGSPLTEPNRIFREAPQHLVNLSAFRISKYEVTNAEYAFFLNAIGVRSDGRFNTTGGFGMQRLIAQSSIEMDGTSNWGVNYDEETTTWLPVLGYENHPAIFVTWYGANEFACWVGGTLPTEAQWEYACRAGTTTPFSLGNAGNGKSLYGSQANFNGGYPYDLEQDGLILEYEGSDNAYLAKTSPVGSYTPNAWGLYDMHGNVFEWCIDLWDGSANYPATEVTDPVVTVGDNRVLRGGSWLNYSQVCRSAFRSYGIPGCAFEYIGFRVAFAF